MTMSSKAVRLAAAFGALLLSNVALLAQPVGPRTPVLVELFTSEGCSSCPPADALLKTLSETQPIANADIIILGEHVDYWDSLGWRDRFSSATFTQRQNQYANRFHIEGPYTPQMVVDGASEFVGNDRAKAFAAIARAAQAPKLALALTPPTASGRSISASVSMAAASGAAPTADVYAALVQPSATTDVPRGENSGRRLQHAGVVRSLERIGSLKDLNHAPLAFTLTAPQDASPHNLSLVVFAQASGQDMTHSAVLGATVRQINP